MKTVWCLTILAIALVDGRGTYVTIPQDYVSGILQASADCVAKHGVDEDIIKKMIAWTVQNTEPFRNFLFCFTSKAGFADDDGHLIVEKMMKLVENHKKKDDFESVLNECNQIKGSDKYDTVFKTVSCFQEKSPILLKV